MPRLASILRHALHRPKDLQSLGHYLRIFTQSSRLAFPCPHCPRTFRSERARAQHMSKRTSCREAEESLPTRMYCTGAEAAENDAVVENGSMVETRGIGELEEGWEAPSSNSDDDSTRNGNDESKSEATGRRNQAHHTENYPSGSSTSSKQALIFDISQNAFVERFPDSRAGAPINDNIAQMPELSTYMAAMGNLGNPFHFATAELLMTTGLTATGRDKHLKSHMYVGRTPWKNNKTLMDDIDKLPHGPGWKIYEINIDETGQRLHRSYLFTRDIVEVVLAIIADPAFKDDMHYAPERHWTSADGKMRVYGNPWTGNWWWRTQIRLPDKSGTIIPVFVATDRTKLSIMSGGQEAYPVYITVGNIEKSVRRKSNSKATALLAYLPVDAFDHANNDDEKARMKNELTHRAMEKVMEPLRKASTEGVEMLCADGKFRRGYPIVAGVIGDWPEHCMMACVGQNRCPKCQQSWEGRGGYGYPAPARTNRETLQALKEYFEGGHLDELKALGLKPWWPWWANLPYVDFHASVMPDMLHQLHQGMVKKHLMYWLTDTIGPRRLDACFMSMTEAHNMRYFKYGIRKIGGQWTGRESREVAKQVLSIAAAQDPNKVEPDLTRVVRAVLEFTYRAHASRMTDRDLERLESALAELHQFKDVLVRERVYQTHSHFNSIAKLHMLLHYVECVCEMGTPDNFSTETPEHLHIESAKAPWRASNKVRPTPQMVRFIQRYEALRIQRAYMHRFLGLRDSIEDEKVLRKSRIVYEEDEEAGAGTEADASDNTIYAGKSQEDDKDAQAHALEQQLEEEEEAAEGEHVRYEGRRASDVNQHVVYPDPTLSMALRPTGGCVKGTDIVAKYGATNFLRALHTYLRGHSTRQNIPTAFLPTLHHHFNVWHRFYLHHQPLPFDPENPKRDVLRARPQTKDRDAAFDVVMILYRPGEFGLHRYRAGRIRTIFSLPKTMQNLCAHPLVYVELFNPFSTTVSPFHRLNTVTTALNSIHERQTGVYSIFDAVAACHLAPNLRRLDEKVNLRSRPDLLAICRDFFFNHFYNHYIFGLVEQWRFAQEGEYEDE